jgi:hypothetical protein
LVGLGKAADVGYRSERPNAIDPKVLLRRRRVTLVALLCGNAIGAVLLLVAPSLGASLITVFGLGVIIDVALLARRQQHVEEWAMTVAFRSRGRGTSPRITHSRPGP